MKLLAILVAAGIVIGVGAYADETQPQTPTSSSLDLAPHAQPSERQIEELPQSTRNLESVDTSPRAQHDVDQLYRQLMHETRPTGGVANP